MQQQQQARAAARAASCGYKIAFFGALTGSAANLGINIEQGAELAVKQYNDEERRRLHHDGEVRLAGRPGQAPGVARQLVHDKKILGIVGPAFSGESDAANPIFNEAGIPLITPSATSPVLATGVRPAAPVEGLPPRRRATTARRARPPAATSRAC